MRRVNLELVEGSVHVGEVVGVIIKRSSRQVTAQTMSSKIQADGAPGGRQSIAEPVETVRVIQPTVEEQDAGGASGISLERMEWDSLGEDLNGAWGEGSHCLRERATSS